ncbi:MAG: type VI secretion system tube protein Hcp [Proteobacteria bacterium]|nr:type VI secretion system tube protein Hcp [Pseudomonadota bacterium]MBU4294366.1 type VI secretion system tube protein Hcp [Pseudomonadota bacterium]MCG2749153.1 type VI secretion system tube protein Hcp [Desulfobulbaceae bacterium]
MSADNYLQITGIKGESTDDKHKDWIEILSFNWGVSQMASASQSTSGGGTSQRADFQDLSIVKLMDSASPLLFKACATGVHLDEVKLELCRAGGDKLLYMEYIMNNVIISSLSVGGGGGGEPTESVTFNYGKIKLNYIKQARKGGGASGNVPAGWDLQNNKDF